MKFPRLILTFIIGLIAVCACEKTPEDHNGPKPEGEKNDSTEVVTKAEYAKATGMEALFGALYLLGRIDRLNELFSICIEE
jgi:hypothetical protein